jgi:hypothetical protein
MATVTPTISLRRSRPSESILVDDMYIRGETKFRDKLAGGQDRARSVLKGIGTDNR